MGMYTEFNVTLELKSDTPKDVIRILNHMIGMGDLHVNKPKHNLFITSRWNYMCNCDSHYFVPISVSAINKRLYHDMYSLHIHSSFKNYDNEINLFLDWITPYIDREGFIGYSRYEEDDIPTLYYYSDGKILNEWESE